MAPRAAGRYIREEFDRMNEFVAVKSFTCNGVPIQPGDRFDKTMVSTRLLRQLYDGRYLTQVASHQIPVGDGTTPRMPDFSSLTKEGLIAWLESNGVYVHPLAESPRLISQCQRRWQALYQNGSVRSPTGSESSSNMATVQEGAPDGVSSGEVRKGYDSQGDEGKAAQGSAPTRRRIGGGRRGKSRTRRAVIV